MMTPISKKRKSHLPKKQLFSEHLEELRYRVTLSFFSFAVATIIGYLIHDKISELLIRPLKQPVFYVSPAGGFSFVLNISLFFGFLISLPVFIYNVIRFVEPALPKKYPYFSIYFLLASLFLMLTGVAFAYLVSLPAALYFLNKFATDEVRALISTTEYFSFITHYLIGFGLIFQLPLVMIVINSIKKISIKTLFKYEKWVIAISFLIAAILTPTPDLFNQTIMALPIILLYQSSLLLLWIMNQKRPATYD